MVNIIFCWSYICLKTTWLWNWWAWNCPFQVYRDLLPENLSTPREHDEQCAWSGGQFEFDRVTSSECDSLFRRETRNALLTLYNVVYVYIVNFEINTHIRVHYMYVYTLSHCRSWQDTRMYLLQYWCTGITAQKILLVREKLSPTKIRSAQY